MMLLSLHRRSISGQVASIGFRDGGGTFDIDHRMREWHA